MSALLHLTCRMAEHTSSIFATVPIEMTIVNTKQAIDTRGFIRKHWLGAYSFPRSFWLHAILLSWFVPVAALNLLSSDTWNFPARATSVAFVVVFLMFYPSLFWGMSGTARAATLYRENGGRRIWPIVAMYVMVFLFADSIYFFIGTRGIVTEHFHMAFTGTFARPASISVVNNGTELLIAGELREGSAEAFALAIHRSPSITTIALDSKGGSLQEASLLAKGISQRGLDTYAKQECSSACTFAFLAGRHRCLGQGARIGFHAASHARDLSRKTFQDIGDIERDMYAKAGLPGPFINTIMETPNNQAWYPSRQELLQAGVTTPDCP